MLCIFITDVSFDQSDFVCVFALHDPYWSPLQHACVCLCVCESHVTVLVISVHRRGAKKKPSICFLKEICVQSPISGLKSR